jgi:hypothetical protein
MLNSLQGIHIHTKGGDGIELQESMSSSVSGFLEQKGLPP